MDDTSPVIHANENDRLAQLNGPGDNTTAVVSAEPNFKTGVEAKRERRQTRRIHQFQSRHHGSTGVVIIHVSHLGSAKTGTHHDDGEHGLGRSTGGLHNVYGQASRLIQPAANGKGRARKSMMLLTVFVRGPQSIVHSRHYPLDVAN